MRTSNWTFTPDVQPPGQAAVFELRPLNMEGLYELQRSFDEKGTPGFASARLAFEYAVIGWQGAKLDGKQIEFSREAKREVLNGVGDPDWMLFLFQIAGELYRQALLTESERKN